MNSKGTQALQEADKVRLLWRKMSNHGHERFQSYVLPKQPSEMTLRTQSTNSTNFLAKWKQNWVNVTSAYNSQNPTTRISRSMPARLISNASFLNWMRCRLTSSNVSYSSWALSLHTIAQTSWRQQGFIQSRQVGLRNAKDLGHQNR